MAPLIGASFFKIWTAGAKAFSAKLAALSNARSNFATQPTSESREFSI